MPDALFDASVEEKLRTLAQKTRVDIITMIAAAQSGHPAGSLGMTDIFTYLYFYELAHQAQNPSWQDRDYLLLSNGHICPVLYATLAQAGYFSPEILSTFRSINSPLQGHPHKGSVPGVENTSGPLGQGISQAVGLALALQRDGKSNRVFCVMSDGEHQEGQVWEAYMLASHSHLKNLTVLIDANNIQISGRVSETLKIEPLAEKIESFGWNTLEVPGHNFSEIHMAFEARKLLEVPTALICRTTPGKGVSFMENNFQWHGKAPNKEQTVAALAELTQAA